MSACTVPIAMDASAPLFLLCFPVCETGETLSLLYALDSYSCRVQRAMAPQGTAALPRGWALGAQGGLGAHGLRWGSSHQGQMALGGSEQPLPSPGRARDKHPAGKMGMRCVIMHMHEGRENGSIYRNSAFFSLLSARLCRNIKPSLSVWVANIPIHPPAKKNTFLMVLWGRTSCLTGLLLGRKLGGTNVDLLLHSSLWLDKRFLKIGLI